MLGQPLTHVVVAGYFFKDLELRDAKQARRQQASGANNPYTEVKVDSDSNSPSVQLPRVNRCRLLCGMMCCRYRVSTCFMNLFSVMIIAAVAAAVALQVSAERRAYISRRCVYVRFAVASSHSRLFSFFCSCWEWSGVCRRQGQRAHPSPGRAQVC